MKSTSFFLKQDAYQQRAENELLIVIFMLFVLYFASSKISFKVSLPKSEMAMPAPTQVDSRKNIVDILWGCQPQSMVDRRSDQCSSLNLFSVRDY